MANTTKKVDSEEKVYQLLRSIDVSNHIEKKPAGQGKELSYLSWAWAFDEISKVDPEWNFKVVEFDNDGIEVPEGTHGHPYQLLFDSSFFVVTEVTVKGRTKRMFLPMMDNRNNALRKEAYTISRKVYGKVYTETVKAADSFDLNKNILRCLVKNLALFGLGLYIFAGEDLPDTESEVVSTKVDATTGEVVTNKTSTTSVKDSEGVGKLGMTLEEAKAYKLEYAGEHKGMPVYERCIENSKNKEKSLEFLRKYAERGIKNDSVACQVLLKALDEALITFPASAEVDAGDSGSTVSANKEEAIEAEA